jgi:hypothetical protein
MKKTAEPSSGCCSILHHLSHARVPVRASREVTWRIVQMYKDFVALDAFRFFDIAVTRHLVLKRLHCLLLTVSNLLSKPLQHGNFDISFFSSREGKILLVVI